jgi:hypothetical protein
LLLLVVVVVEVVEVVTQLKVVAEVLEDLGLVQDLLVVEHLQSLSYQFQHLQVLIQ